LIRGGKEKLKRGVSDHKKRVGNSSHSKPGSLKRDRGRPEFSLARCREKGR